MIRKLRSDGEGDSLESDWPCGLLSGAARLFPGLLETLEEALDKCADIPGAMDAHAELVCAARRSGGEALGYMRGSLHCMDERKRIRRAAAPCWKKVPVCRLLCRAAFLQRQEVAMLETRREHREWMASALAFLFSELLDRVSAATSVLETAGRRALRHRELGVWRDEELRRETIERSGIPKDAIVRITHMLRDEASAACVALFTEFEVPASAASMLSIPDRADRRAGAAADADGFAGSRTKELGLACLWAVCAPKAASKKWPARRWLPTSEAEFEREVNLQWFASGLTQTRFDARERFEELRSKEAYILQRQRQGSIECLGSLLRMMQGLKLGWGASLHAFREEGRSLAFR